MQEHKIVVNSKEVVISNLQNITGDLVTSLLYSISDELITNVEYTRSKNILRFKFDMILDDETKAKVKEIVSEKINDFATSKIMDQVGTNIPANRYTLSDEERMQYEQLLKS